MGTSATSNKSFRVTSADRLMLMSTFVSDIIVRAVIVFDGRTDVDRLRHALYLALDAVPVVGCRFRERWWRPCFDRMEHLEEKDLLKVLTVDGAEQDEAVLKRYLLAAFDPTEGPLLRAALIRGQQDTLCLKLHHLSADGAGVIAFAYLLAKTYKELGQDPDYHPAPGSGDGRSLWQVLRRLKWTDVVRGFFLPGVTFWTDPGWSLPLSCEMTGTPDMVTRILPPARLRAIRAYAHAHGATINDVLFAAWYRAVYRQIRPPRGTRLEISTHVNFRRRLPAAQKGIIANLSQMLPTCIGTELGDSLADTVTLVHAEMTRLKTSPPSLWMSALIKIVPHRWAGRLTQMMADQAARSEQPMLANTLFNNVGVLDAERLAMGAPVANAYITACVPLNSSLQLVICTCNEQLNLGALFREIGNNRQVLDALLDGFEEELAAVGGQDPAVAGLTKRALPIASHQRV